MKAFLDWLVSKKDHIWGLLTRSELWALVGLIIVYIQDNRLVDPGSKWGILLGVVAYIIARTVKKSMAAMAKAKAMSGAANSDLPSAGLKVEDVKPDPL
jgi:glucose dehydrogenase